MDPLDAELGVARVAVSLGDRSYSIMIGAGLIERVPKWMERSGVTGTHAVCVFDEQVKLTHGTKLLSALKRQSIRTSVYTVPSGESSKSIEGISALWNWMLAESVDRSSIVFALGGGVVGDLAGFAAATYARGLRVVHLPTTLLSQVDSSVGGKTGINLDGAKNMVGAFWQPTLVLVDIGTLATLPEREYRSGLAEVVKYGVIMDPSFFEWLEMHTPSLLARSPEHVRDMIFRSCRCKAMVVGDDEREVTGRRAILNYGHTFAHAIEATAGYGVWLHGEAVSIGMTCAAKLGVRLGLCDEQVLTRQTQLLKAMGLPTEVIQLAPEELLVAMQHDKKVTDGKLKFILPRSIGLVEGVEGIASADVLQACLNG